MNIKIVDIISPFITYLFGVFVGWSMFYGKIVKSKKIITPEITIESTTTNGLTVSDTTYTYKIK